MKIWRVILLSALTGMMAGCGNRTPYLDMSLPFEARVDDLLSRMTLDEKIGMLRYDSPGVPRLGIRPHNFWNECLHGVGRSGKATVFPQAIGMAAMWDREEMFDIAHAISDEARAKHHDYAARGHFGIYQGLTFWTPNINIFRDPRWGRGMETYGEDPYLTGELAVPFIRGLQGSDPKYLKLVATAKHFAVHSGPEALRHSFDVRPSDYDLRETYLPHFRKTVREAGVYSVMCAYQRLEGEPCCGSAYLNHLLRNEWGFEGYVVSDCGAIADFYEEGRHGVVNTPEEAAAKAIRAGTDLNCGDVYRHLADAVHQGLVTEDELDVSVRRVLLAMMKLGMFDDPAKVPYARIPIGVIDCERHRQLALDASRKSIVLLRNENNVLPLSKELKKIAVIGPNANDLESLLGNYYGYPADPKTPLAGIREKLPRTEVVFAQGCPLAGGLPYLEAVPRDYLFTDTSRTVHGLKAEYFANPDREGDPVRVQTDPQVDFEWWNGTPFPDMGGDGFSIRWSGVFVPPADGRYALGGEGFYGFGLWLDGEKIVSWKSVHHPHRVYEHMNLVGGRPYEIRIEYTQNDPSYNYSLMRLLWDYPKPDLSREAVDLAASSDAVILCMGLNPMLEGEEMPVKVEGFEQGDRVDIRLPSVQMDLIRAVARLGKPTVVVLLNGSAVAFDGAEANIPAVIEAWYPGQDGGTAVADVIFGDYNPAGRLPVTFYRSISDIPAFGDYDMRGKTYRYFSGEPLYPFGYGLSYTTFAYEPVSIPDAIQAGDTLRMAVDVANTGERDGDEVVQLYVSWPGGKSRVPIHSLQGFRRIHLKSGETLRVEFALTPDQIAVYDDPDGARIDPGMIMVSIGGGQPESISPGGVVKTIAVNGTP